MGWLVRFLLLFLAILLLTRWVVRLLASLAKPRAGESGRETLGGHMERDPICGMYVAREVSVSEAEGQKTLYFCSEHCRQEYRASRRALGAGSA